MRQFLRKRKYAAWCGGSSYPKRTRTPGSESCARFFGSWSSKDDCARSLRENCMNPSVLIIPGARNSGPEHWQSLWQAADPSMERLNVNNWDNPTCDSWIKAIDSQVRRALEPVVVVAHSLGCLAFAHWAAQEHSTSRRAAGGSARSGRVVVSGRSYRVFAGAAIKACLQKHRRIQPG